MNTSRTALALATATILAASLAGCVKRKETITVAKDGGVTIRLEYEADSLGELENGDVMPAPESGWSVEHRVEKEDNGDETHALTAERKFEPDAELPENFAAPCDADAKVYLQFPTSLTVEQRPDGMYYHLCRTYQSRPWAQIEARRDDTESVVGDELKEIEDQEPSELTQEQRVTLVKALVYMEYVKMQTFARWAFVDTVPQGPQDCSLLIGAGLKAHAERTDFDRLAELIAAGDDKEQALEAEAAAFEAGARERVQATLLKDCGYSVPEADGFIERYEWHKKRYDVTEDLGDEEFEITVNMPGDIIASNADHTDGGEARWEFDGKMFRDRIVELMVTSRVAK